ncbi:chemotaxis protein CheW [Tropicimonas isoalkanivorans]|uniref:Purine-binding chemotaxis protein CheW n=1 Tax=Tropicimonas isoalkanivorans TaxID=441112 RepID=A0A1I1KCX3_9RHOB|nr:chemotaxis protein CheW [Tropicimonas isoalkanivorans]SFC58677.1 purine-binding chemotaxis protein CheW [Tropicimonas isoalkanivorans]
MNERGFQAHATTDAIERELLSFRVGGQEYCVDIMSVREIRGWTRPTQVPRAEKWVRGVINLRGTVLPIVDLACRLGVSVEDASERNVIIVVNIRQQTVGLLVDAVSDILAIAESDLRPPPEITSTTSETYIKALTIIDDRMLRILDLEAVLPNMRRDAA